MRNPADVPKLEKDHAALGMDGIDDFPPSLDLLLRVDAGHAGAAKSRRNHRRALGNDQPARGTTLRISVAVQRPWRETGLFSQQRGQRRHPDAMTEPIGTDL